MASVKHIWHNVASARIAGNLWHDEGTKRTGEHEVAPKPADAVPKSPTLNRKEAAAYLTAHGYPVAPRTLARLACRDGAGPPYVRFRGRHALYDPAILLGWARSQSEPAGARLPARAIGTPEGALSRTGKAASES